MTNQRDAATILKEKDECGRQLSAALEEHGNFIKPAQAQLDPNNPGAVSVLDLEKFSDSYKKCDELNKKFDELSRELMAASKQYTLSSEIISSPPVPRSTSKSFPRMP